MLWWLSGPQYVPILLLSLFHGLIEVSLVQHVFIYDFIVIELPSHKFHDVASLVAITEVDDYLLIIIAPFIFGIILDSHCLCKFCIHLKVLVRTIIYLIFNILSYFIRPLSAVALNRKQERALG
jgi:cyanate permease